MSRLKIKLYNEGNVVVYRVLEQCDSLKAPKGESIWFIASNGFKISSEAFPIVESSRMCLRGHNHLGYEDADSLVFESERDAEKYIEKVIFALQEWKENGYFEGKKESVNEKGVYEF